MSHPGVGESRRQDRPVLVDWFHAGPNKGQREPVVDRAAGPLRPPRRGTEDTPARRQVGFGAARRAEGVWVFRACARPPTCTGAGVGLAGPGQGDRPGEGLTQGHAGIKSGPGLDMPRW